MSVISIGSCKKRGRAREAGPPRREESLAPKEGKG